MKEYEQKRKVEKGISNEEREKNNQYMKSYRAKKKCPVLDFKVS